MHTRSVFSLLLLAALAPASAQTCDTEWAAPTDGAWTTPTAWTNGLPGPDDVACVLLPGTYTVVFDGSRPIGQLFFGGESGTQTLRLDRTVTSLGGGRVGPNGRVEVLNSANCSSCDGLPMVEGTLIVEGVITHTAGTGLLSAGGTLDIAPGGLLSVDTGVNTLSIGTASADAVSTVRVRGRAEFAPASGTSRRATVRGRVEVIGGTLDVRGTDRVDVTGEGLLRDATIEVGEGMNLWLLTAGNTSGTYAVEGTLGGTPEGDVVVLGGATLEASPSGATLAVGGAGLQLSASSGQTTFLRSAGGAFTNTALVSLVAGSIQLDGAAFRNEGTFRNEDARLTLANNARVENTGGGLLDIVDQGSVYGGTDGGRVVSMGRIATRLVGRSSARPVFQVPVDLTDATVEMAANMRLQMSEGVWQDVAFDIPETGEVLLTSANSNGLSGDFETSGTFSGDVGGALTLSGARFLASAGNTTLAFGGNGATLRGYALGSDGGGFVNAGLVTFVNNVPEVRGVAVRNEGTIRVDNTSLTLSESATLTNVTSATVDLVAGGGFSGSGAFVNEGLVLKTGGGSSEFRGGLRGQPGSELRVLSGRYFFRDEEPANYGVGVRLTGAGETASFYLNAPIQGTLSPGTPDQPIAELAVNGNLRLSSADGDARLVIDVAQDTSDVVLTGSAPALGGTLIIRLAEGHTPAVGDEWTIMSGFGGRATGAFESTTVEGGTGFELEVDTAEAGVVVLRLAQVGTVDAEDDAPAFALGLAAYPNPVAARATVEVTLPEATDVQVEAFDAVGRRVAVLHDGPLAAGVHALAFDTAALLSGITIVRAVTTTGTASRTVTVVR